MLWIVGTLLSWVLGIGTPALVLYAVLSKDKTIGALVQLGSIQRRLESTQQLAERSEHDLRKSVQFNDKATFTLSVINLATTMYVLGAAPGHFYRLHTPKAILLISWRWITFRSQKKHYLLYDFCYWANFLILLYIWVFPKNDKLFQIIFMIANGPLAWSMLAFSHSLIFHSRPHMTSVFIHASPMLMVHALRFNESQFGVCPGGRSGGMPRDVECYVPPFTLIFNAVAYFYIWWLLMYYIWVFVVLAPRIERRGLQTLYDRVCTSGPLKGIMAALGDTHPLLKKAVYMLVHFLFAIATMVLTVVCWYNFWAHFFFVLVMLTVPAWNAAGFYFNVFSRKYEQSLIDRIRKLEAGVQQTAKGPVGASAAPMPRQN